MRDAGEYDVCPGQLELPSPDVARDASAGDERRICNWCANPIDARARRDAKFCGVKCRQASHRFGYRRCQLEATDQPMRFAYADPPYPGKSHLYPEGTEVDPYDMLRQLVEFDHWALSTSAEALPDLLIALSAFPEFHDHHTGARVRVGSWVKAPRRGRSARPLSSWEPVIFFGGRPLAVDLVQTTLDAVVARGRYNAFPGAMIGMKPPEFSWWMFECLGARPGDEFVDVFPGSGAVSKAWERFTAAGSDASDLEMRRVADPEATGAVVGRRATGLVPA